jgi:hypothetical protein
VHLPNAPEMFSSRIGSRQGIKATVGLRQCNLKGFMGLCDLLMMVFMIVILYAIAAYQNDFAGKLDEAEQTAQDYSVIIRDPNSEMVDPDEWKNWFEDRFGDDFGVIFFYILFPFLFESSLF